MGGVGSGRVGWGCQGGCKRRIEVFEKIQIKFRGGGEVEGGRSRGGRVGSQVGVPVGGCSGWKLACLQAMCFSKYELILLDSFS